MHKLDCSQQYACVALTTPSESVDFTSSDYGEHPSSRNMSITSGTNPDFDLISCYGKTGPEFHGLTVVPTIAESACGRLSYPNGSIELGPDNLPQPKHEQTTPSTVCHLQTNDHSGSTNYCNTQEFTGRLTPNALHKSIGTPHSDAPTIFSESCLESSMLCRSAQPTKHDYINIAAAMGNTEQVMAPRGSANANTVAIGGRVHPVYPSNEWNGGSRYSPVELGYTPQSCYSQPIERGVDSDLVGIYPQDRYRYRPTAHVGYCSDSCFCSWSSTSAIIGGLTQSDFCGCPMREKHFSRWDVPSYNMALPHGECDQKRRPVTACTFKWMTIKRSNPKTGTVKQNYLYAIFTKNTT